MEVCGLAGRYIRVMPASRPRGRKPGSKMTDDHKAALAKGREESRLVKAYLEVTDAAGLKKRGRKRTPESIAKRLRAIDSGLPGAPVLSRLQMLQEKADLQEELVVMTADNSADVDAARAGFVRVAKAYGDRKGIAYSTWRSAGVDAPTLKDAGISRATK